jgi:WXG100 family type VII secretion target
LGVLVGGFDATPVELQVCGSMLTQISQDVRTEMRVLQQEMDALLGGGWQGSAANGFAQGWEQWRRGASEVLDALHTMGRLLGDTGANYQAGDTGSAEQLKQSGTGL